MRRCCDTHRLCNAPIDDFLPTRLISVNGTHPYLSLTSQLKIKPKYATLSHCCKYCGLIYFLPSHFQGSCTAFSTLHPKLLVLIFMRPDMIQEL
jgi:hypothetical protein